MEEIPYSKREQDEFKNDVKNRFDKQDMTLGQILEQTTRHNGRMYKIEEWIGQAKIIIESNLKNVDQQGKVIASLDKKATKFTTFIAVLIFVSAAIGYLYIQLIDSKINEAVSTVVPQAVNLAVNQALSIAVPSAVDKAFTSRFSGEQIVQPEGVKK